MKGDFSQHRFRPENRFASLRAQQGRVGPLDAELNEAADIARYLDETTRYDTIGPCGVPRTGGGFALTLLSADDEDSAEGEDFTISPGRIYIDGILAEAIAGITVAPLTVTTTGLTVTAPTLDGEPLVPGQWLQLSAIDRDPQSLRITAVADATVDGEDVTELTVVPDIANPDDLETPQLQRLTTLLHQPDYPDPAFPPLTPAPAQLPADPGIYLAYLDLWQRHLTALELPHLREVALHGPDTTTRLKTLAQVKLLRVAAPGEAAPSCLDFGSDWRPTPDLPRRLMARAEPDPVADRPCIVPAQAGYRRLENQLYRVEIHRGGDADSATFKWSRNNGTLVSRWLASDSGNDQLAVDSLGPDDVFSFQPNQWVELTDETYDLHNQSGPLLPLANAVDNTLILQEGFTADISDFPRLPKVRGWDHGPTRTRDADGNPTPLALADGAIPVREGVWIDLEDGVQVWFEPGGTYAVGDHWLIPARVVGGDVIWPRDDGGSPLLEPPLGIVHHYCRLALLERTSSGWSPTVTDCRPDFPPLTDLDDGGCCERVRPGESVQTAINRLIAAGGGCLCLGHGVHTVSGPLRLTRARHLKISGESPVTTLRLLADADGAGGIWLEDSAHVTLHQLFVVGEGPEVLVDERAPSHHVTFSHSTLLNRSSLTSDGFNCALRLTAAVDVRLESCRLVAAVGILSLLGAQLPTAPELFTDSPQVLDFEALELGRTYRAGDTLEAPWGAVEVFEFRRFPGTVEDSRARVDNNQRSGGTGQDLNLSSIGLAVEFTRPQRRVSWRYGGDSTGIALSINGGEPVAIGRFEQLHGQTLEGVIVTVLEESLEGLPRGEVILTGEIAELTLAATSLWIDNVAVSEEAPPTLSPVPPQRITLQEVEVRYGDYGIWALEAQDWQLEACDFRALPLAPQAGEVPRLTDVLRVREVRTPQRRSRPGIAEEFSAGRLRPILDQLRQRLSEDSPMPQNLVRYAQLLRGVDELFEQPGSDRGVVLRAMFWRSCHLRRCYLQGAVAAEVGWWMGGSAQSNTIHSTRRGLGVLWLHEALWAENDCRSQSGFSFGIGGGYRSTLRGNQVRQSQFGLRSLPSDGVLSELGNYLEEGLRYYGGAEEEVPQMLWLGLNRLVELWQLAPLVQQLQEIANRANLRLPALYWLGQAVVQPLMRSRELRLPLGLPMIGLTIADNAIEATHCIHLEPSWTLGGMAIQGNRLHTTTGQALLLRAANANNVHLLIYVWRLFMQLLPELLDTFASRIRGFGSQLPDGVQPLVQPTAAFFNGLGVQLRRWQQESEGFLDADYRVESNSIRSLDTAIVSNIFELAILDNHITLQERPQQRQDGLAVVEELRRSSALEPLALAVSEGSRADITRAVGDLNESPQRLTADVARRDASAALTGINSRVGDPQLRQRAVALNAALQGADTDAQAEALTAFAEALVAYVDSYGILLEGAGGRIVGNQIVVPVDVDPDTWTRGGIRLSLPLQPLLYFVAIAVALQQWLFNQADDDSTLRLDPLLGVTETLVDNNEILGGIGHGIDVEGFDDLLEVLVKLKLRHNQISGMGGAGIFINERAVVINLDIEDNRVSECSNAAELASLTGTQSGIDIHSVLFCRLHGNRINTCGPSGQSQLPVYAVNLEAIYDLSFNDNSVQYNFGGGVRLANVFGQATLADNDISANRGVGLSWENVSSERFAAAASTKAFSPTIGLQRFAVIARQPQPADTGRVQASVQGNQIHVPAGQTALAFILNGLNQLIFSGNHASVHSTTDAVGAIATTDQAVIAHNILMNHNP